MLFSESFIFTTREDPKVAECRSQKLLLRGSFLFMVSSGIYSYLPLGQRVLDNISAIIRKHMNAQGAQELLMSALQPIELWEKTGRDEDLKEVMFKFQDRKNRTLCLGPTHEEEITEIARKYIVSYKQLPRILYQIQVKFRDEPRPRFGLMRSCEFMMKDAYSFDIDEKGLNENYEKMRYAYNEIFKECGLNYVMVEADPGMMGGSASHEFMVPAPIGEDILFYCDKCKKYFKEKGKCSDCGKNLKEERMVEVGHIFQLGTKYSLAQEAFFLDKDGQRRPFVMGCYGIGVSRLIPAIAEQCSDAKGFAWPGAIAPFDVSLVMLDDKLFKDARDLEESLSRQGLKVLVDERNEAAGVKFNDAYLIGNPYIVIMGKNYIQSQKFDVEVRKSSDKLSFSKEELLNFLKDEYGKRTAKPDTVKS